MTNKIGYNQYPDKDEFESLYVTKSQQELSQIYECNKSRINKWIKHFGFDLRTRGGAKPEIYNFDKTELSHLVDFGYSDIRICEILNIKSKTTLYKWFKKFGISRVYNTPAQIKYTRFVRVLTEKSYVENKHILNPHNYPRTLCGVDGGYQLDHIKGIADCFRDGISIDDCASLENLQMVTWQENLYKRTIFKGVIKNV